MRKSYLFLSILLSIALIFNIASIYYSISAYRLLKEPIFAARASEGELSLTVETSTASCGDSICNSGETCSTCDTDCGICPIPSPSPSSPSSGGGVSYVTPKFTVQPQEINIQIAAGKSDSREILVKNTGSERIIIDLNLTGIGQFTTFNTNRIVLDKGQQKSLIMTVSALEPGVYAGKIRFKSGSVTKEVLVLLNVVSEGVLFDVSITIPELYKNLHVGENLPTLIELLEIG